MTHRRQLTPTLTLVHPHGARKHKRSHAHAKKVLHRAIYDGHVIAKLRSALSGDPTVAKMTDQQFVIRISGMIDAGQLHIVDNLAYKEIPITSIELADLFPAATDAYLQTVAIELNTDLSTYGLGTLLRRAHFFAQVRAEAGPGMHSTVESLNYSVAGLESTFPDYFGKHKDEAVADAYVTDPKTKKIVSRANEAEIANHAYAKVNGNGDYASGDGWTYRGRGLIQTTGRGNYESTSTEYAKLYPKAPIDFVAHPDLMAQFPYSVRAAVCYWVSHKLPARADLGSKSTDVDRITRVVNYHTKSYGERESYFKTAYAALMSVSLLVLVISGLMSASALARQSKGLQCRSDETTLFACSIGEKVALLCGSRRNDALFAINYRYGTPGAVENEFVAAIENKNRFSAFAAPLRPDARIDQVWFDKGEYRYMMSECVGGMCPEDAKLTVFSKGRVISNRTCSASASATPAFPTPLVDFVQEKSGTDLVTYDPTDNDIAAIYK